MNIYIGHSTGTEYQESLYRPLKDSSIDERHELVLPHDSDEFFNSRKFLGNECDLFVAEVSEASTGLGIELGWADSYGVNLICIHQENSDPSSALKAVADELHSYSSADEMLEVINKKIEVVASENQ